MEGEPTTKLWTSSDDHCRSIRKQVGIQETMVKSLHTTLTGPENFWRKLNDLIFLSVGLDNHIFKHEWEGTPNKELVDFLVEYEMFKLKLNNRIDRGFSYQQLSSVELESKFLDLVRSLKDTV